VPVCRMTPERPRSYEDFLKRVSPESVVHFDDGLPGFGEEGKFIILQDPDETPFAWMQSLRTPKLAFVVTSPFVLFPDYRPDVPDDALSGLGSPTLDEVLVLCILRIVRSEPVELLTNLKAPIIINLRSLAARQVVLLNESMYSERAAWRGGGS